MPAVTWGTGVHQSIVAQMIARNDISTKGSPPPEKAWIDLDDLNGIRIEHFIGISVMR